MKKNTATTTLRGLGIAICAALVLLGGCKPKAEPKSVSYYAENQAERDQVVAACKDNPGKFKDDPDCINANDAAIQAWGKAKLPPVGFGASTPASGPSN